MRRPVEGRMRGFARDMRTEATKAEGRLWSALRNGNLNALKFRRQVPIGNAIADFVCYEHKLIVEVDGGQHSESKRETVRDAELERCGFRVLRFWNIDVLRNTRSVVETILAVVRGELSADELRRRGDPLTPFL